MCSFGFALLLALHAHASQEQSALAQDAHSGYSKKPILWEETSAFRGMTLRQAAQSLSQTVLRGSRNSSGESQVLGQADPSEDRHISGEVRGVGIHRGFLNKSLCNQLLSYKLGEVAEVVDRAGSYYTNLSVSESLYQQVSELLMRRPENHIRSNCEATVSAHFTQPGDEGGHQVMVTP
eukprot:TRINITY_DN24599_c1_g1_i1.p1 TRINITY_DN24599_c1_g1~~TRINITY_DN24599_c1_g1_i1.p1  ORF type:complete len:202 (+),score=29.94 TRINITY_DN24599_c1_g1_i1:72-608(+)